MSISLQKAGLWKRISAYLFDMILTAMLVVGIATLLSAAFGYDRYNDQLEEYTTQYAQKYGIDLNITEEAYNGLSEEEKANYEAANKAFSADERVQETYGKLFSIGLSVTSLSILSTYLILYFAIPLFLHDGKTLGKKIFGLAVMRTNCVKISGPILFVRSILGQCTIETMVPVMLITMLFFGVIGSVGSLVLILLLILQIAMMCVTQTNSAIHDLLADTVVVDYSSQKIFDSEEELIAFKAAQHEKEVSQNQDFGRLDPKPEIETKSEMSEESERE